MPTLTNTMPTLTVTEKDDKFFFEGTINEKFDFDHFFSNKLSPLVLNMNGVKRINSVGVRGWAAALTRFPYLQLILEECSRSVVDQCNLLPEFMVNNQVRVRSFFTHYYSEETGEEQRVLLEEGRHFIFGKGIIQEPEVGEGMELDDIPKKYFNFLTLEQPQ